MTKEELAKKLNGKSYRDEISSDILRDAKVNGLVIIYGHSDDLMELEGAIEDEGGCYDGGEFFLDKNGLLPDTDDIDEAHEMVAHRKRQRTAKKITALRFANGQPAWSYKTKIPHACFDVMEDGEVQCRGIVFSKESL
jgi:hypothetical protein